MAWQTIDQGARVQLPSIPQPPPPVARPVFPMYNVVMDALKSILPALDPLEIATRKAKLAAIQLQLSPQMQALQKKQIEAQSEALDFQKAHHDWLRTHGFITPRPGQYPASYPDPKALSGVVDQLPVADDGPPGTSLGTDKKIDASKPPQVETAPQIPDQIQPPLTPEQGDQQFGPLPMPGGEVPVGPPQGAAPQGDVTVGDITAAGPAGPDWRGASDNLGIPLGNEEEQAMTPQIMV